MYMAPFLLCAALLSMTDAASAMGDVRQTHNGANAMATEISADAKQLLRTESLNPPAASNHGTAKSPAPAPTKSVSTAANAKDVGQKIAHIELYYETRCPDCVEFLNMSLAPLWRNKELRAHYNISINPYGNAQSVPMSEISQGYKFWHKETSGKGFDMVHICQHGTDECFGNLVQACAIKDETPEKHMELAFCMASHPEYGIEKSSYECMQSLGMDAKKNKECVFGARGNQILSEFGKLTRAVKGRLGTPWVMINGDNLKNPMHLTESVCTFVGPNSLTTCKPFQEKPTASKEEPEHDHEDDFQVFGKLDTVDKNLVILPPPEHA